MSGNTFLNAFALISVGLFAIIFIPCIWKIFFGKFSSKLALHVLWLQFLFFLLPAFYKSHISHTIYVIYYIIGFCLLIYVGLLFIWKISLLHDSTPQKAGLRILGILLILSATTWVIYFATTPLALFLASMFLTIGLITTLARPFCSFFGSAFSYFILSLPDEHDYEIPFISSPAEGLRKQGKSEEAIAEIDNQLQRIPGNVDAILLKATILAEDLGKVDDASNLIHEVLTSSSAKKIEPSTYSLLKNRVCDWQLQYNHSIEKAQFSLKEIILKYPDSPYAFLAKQRITKLCLPEGRKDPEVIKLGNYKKDIGLDSYQVSTGKQKIFKPLSITNNQDTSKEEFLSLETYLETNPEDCEARERMASIFAREIGDLETAIYLLDYLLAQQQNAPRDKFVRWYNLKADYYILFGKLDEAKESLKEIIDLYPDTPVAVIAERRINRLKLELQKQVIFHKLPKSDANLGLRNSGKIVLPARNDLTTRKIPVRLVASFHGKVEIPPAKTNMPGKTSID